MKAINKFTEKREMKDKGIEWNHVCVCSCPFSVFSQFHLESGTLWQGIVERKVTVFEIGYSHKSKAKSIVGIDSADGIEKVTEI